MNDSREDQVKRDARSTETREAKVILILTTHHGCNKSAKATARHRAERLNGTTQREDNGRTRQISIRVLTERKDRWYSFQCIRV